MPEEIRVLQAILKEKASVVAAIAALTTQHDAFDSVTNFEAQEIEVSGTLAALKTRLCGLEDDIATFTVIRFFAALCKCA